MGANVTLYVYALSNNSQFYPSITLLNSSLRFQVIYLQSSLQITLSDDSYLDANGTGFDMGLGFNQK